MNCPAVAPSLPAIPASAKAEVDRNLALLNTQIAEANKRLVDTVGQGGPNFVQNAILGPLKDKRVATINRIATAIGRTAAKPHGTRTPCAACTLNRGRGRGGAGAAATGAERAGHGAGAAVAAGARCRHRRRHHHLPGRRLAAARRPGLRARPRSTATWRC